MVADLGREHLQRAADEPDGPVRVMAGATPAHQARPPLKVGEHLRAGPWARQFLQRARYARQAVEARPALADRLKRKITGRAASTPAPTAAPSGRSAALARGSSSACAAGSHAP